MNEIIEDQYHVEVAFFQYNHYREKISGDVFLSKRIPEENRVLGVLSDGMGHGVKANVLATLTATISINLSQEHKNANTIADIIMKALPVCSERKISYATYTIIDISIDAETVNILEYDNPQTILMRGKRIYEPNWVMMLLDKQGTDIRERDLKTCSFRPQLGDRIISCSDGVTQSGLGMGMTIGWGRNSVINYIRELIEINPTISAGDIAEKVVKRSAANDQQTPKDDITCGVFYFRQPRKIIICTGPPFNMEQDYEFAQKLKTFPGKKIIAGATTTEIIARELNRPVTDEPMVDNTLPPSSFMEGIDLVTEGVLTLSKVIKMLDNLKNPNFPFGNGPADKMCKLLLESDKIHILVGTKINESHHDPNLPVEIEIRRNLMQKLIKVLTDKYLKVVNVEFM
ncbi:MAG: SpoIIE family protein phosphatase [Bacteroidales bacterium]